MRNNLLSSVKWVWSENSKDQVSVGSNGTYLILKVTQNRLGSGIGLDLHFLSTSSLAVVHSWPALKKEIVSGRFFSCLNPSSVRLNLDKVAPERRLLGEYWTISYRNFNSGLINSLTHLSKSSSKIIFTVLCIRECLAAVLFWTNLFHKEAFWGILNHSYESWTSTSPSNIHTLHSRLDLYIVVVRNFINTNLHFYSLHQRVFHSRFLLIYGAIVIEAPTAGTKGKGQIICQRWLLHSWILVLEVVKDLEALWHSWLNNAMLVGVWVSHTGERPCD